RRTAEYGLPQLASPKATAKEDPPTKVDVRDIPGEVTVNVSRDRCLCLRIIVLWRGIKPPSASLLLWTCQERTFNSIRSKNWRCRSSISCTTSLTGLLRIAKKPKTWSRKPTLRH